MQPHDAEKFSEIMTGLAENFGGHQISVAGLMLGFKVLQRFSIEQIEAGALKLIDEKPFPKMPTIAEIREAIQGGRQELEDRSAVEAAKVINAVKRVGGYQSVVFDDPVTMAVIRRHFGGWIKLCNEGLAEEEKWILKDFAKIYRAFSRQGIKEFGKLEGVFALQNGSHGRLEHIPPPVVIGDPEKARAVLEHKPKYQSVKVIEFLPELKSIEP